MRGNRLALVADQLGHGPIPAYAGQPHHHRDCLVNIRAYPRVCGATIFYDGGDMEELGLSPRMRGNHSTFKG